MLADSVRIALLAIIALGVPGALSGELNPPGPPAPTLIAGLPAATPITAVPLTINQPGVYCFTDSLTVTSTSANGINVNADDVVIDLAGHSLIGPLTGTGRGVSAEASARVTVRNGTVRAFGQRGVSLGQRGLAEDLRIADCPLGLIVGNGGCARRVHVAGSLLIGIDVLNGCELIDCSVADSGAGIGALYASAVTRCSARLCTGDGIIVLGPVVVSDCSVAGAGGEGFRGQLGTVFESCVATGCDVGFLGQDGVTIRDCTARLCSTEGIAVTGMLGSGLVADCHVQATPIGIRVGRPSMIVRNFVNDATLNGIQISVPDVTVLDNVLMGAPTSILHTGNSDNCFYARNTFNSGVNLGLNATWGPWVVGHNDLSDDSGSEHPWANIQH